MKEKKVTKYLGSVQRIINIEEKSNFIHKKNI